MNKYLKIEDVCRNKAEKDRFSKLVADVAGYYESFICVGRMDGKPIVVLELDITINPKTRVTMMVCGLDLKESEKHKDLEVSAPFGFQLKAKKALSAETGCVAKHRFREFAHGDPPPVFALMCLDVTYEQR